jgi:hypothetical protein
MFLDSSSFDVQSLVYRLNGHLIVGVDGAVVKTAACRSGDPGSIPGPGQTNN